MKFRVSYFKTGGPADSRLTKDVDGTDEKTVTKTVGAELSKQGFEIHSVRKAVKYRVSFYDPKELATGRATRNFRDVEAFSREEVVTQIEDEGFKVKSVYKAPRTPIKANNESNFIFKSETARKKWYLKQSTKARSCKKCGKDVERYKRLCENCREHEHNCNDCGTDISDFPYRRLCDTCLARHQAKNEVERKARRKTATVLGRINSQLEKARELLAKATLDRCRNADKYQGLRMPHLHGPTCSACLQKFIETQTNYLNRIREGKVPGINVPTEPVVPPAPVESQGAHA